LRLKNQELLDKLSINAVAYSRQFRWENTAEAFDNIIKNTYWGSQPYNSSWLLLLE